MSAVAATIALLLSAHADPQPATQPAPQAPPPSPPLPPLDPFRRYDAIHVATPPTVDGKLDDAAWADAPWSDPFVDIEGSAKPAPRYRTRMKMVWDDTTLYIAAELEEPDVWATYRTRDQIVFHEPDFEVFIDPNCDAKAYYELEVNCLGTIFDLYLHRMYLQGGPALHGWNCANLRTGITVQGTANEPRDVDVGWTLEWAIPFASLVPQPCELPMDEAEKARAGAAPTPGESWRINFSRVQWKHGFEELGPDGRRIGPKRPAAGTTTFEGAPPPYVKTPATPEDNWVWSPQNAINMHLAARWGLVTFVVR